jgi:hypothetical protein
VTLDELPGLIAAGRTVVEALVMARDVARKVIQVVANAVPWLRLQLQQSG